jgi:hypothetical protein
MKHGEWRIGQDERVLLVFLVCLVEMELVMILMPALSMLIPSAKEVRRLPCSRRGNSSGLVRVLWTSLRVFFSP